MRVDILLLINLISLYSRLHLSFLIDILKIFVRIYIKLYNSINIIFDTLIIFHVEVVLTSKENSLFSSISQLYNLIISFQKIYKRFKYSLYSGRGLSSSSFDSLSSLSSQIVLRAISTRISDLS